MSDASAPPLVIFGCGYVGTRLARAALATGRKVRACARHLERLEPLRALGAELHAIDATRPKQFGPALNGLLSATVVYSIPPLPGVPAGDPVRRATQAALQHGVRNFLYLGSAGLYGSRAELDWIDEETAIATDDPQMASRIADETAVQGAAAAGLRTAIVRLAAIYGPGRGVRKRLRAGDYKLIDGGEHYISRIHVDDLVRILLAAEDKAPPGALYLVGDDRPTLQKEHALWLAARLGLPDPPSVPAFAAGAPRQMQRGRRIRNDKLKRELELTLLYPSYVEGEAQIEAEEAAAGAAPLVDSASEGAGGESGSVALAAAAPPPASPSAASPASATAPSPDDPAGAVRAVLLRLAHAWIAARFDELGELLAEDVVFVPPSFAERTVGRAACVDSYRRLLGSTSAIEYAEEPADVDAFGDTAVASCAWEMACQVDAGWQRERGRDLVVLQRRDGVFRVVFRTRIPLGRAA